MTDATGLTIPADYQARTDALAGRTIVVTGAAAGIGRATARAAARAGASVVLLDKQVRKLESLYDEIEQDGSPEAAIYPMDLLGATPDDHTEMAQRLRESYGSLYAIVHNAADLGQPAPLEHYDPQAWLRTIHINLNAPFLMVRSCLPLMKATESARMVFVSDASGRIGKPYTGAYGASKSGLEGLMRTLAAELPDDSPVTAASIDPGPVHTMLRRKAYPAEKTQGLPSAESAAHGLLYLLDPANVIAQGGAYTFSA